MDPSDRPILVVDDDAKIVRLVRTYLERERYQVVEASDGPSALAAIEATHPRLVVLDLMLPGIDGLAVIRAIRDERDTPVIVLSARGTANDRIVGLGLGADDYVPKPFSPAELVLRVNRVLARSERSHGRPTSEPLELGGLVVDRARVEVRVDGRPVELTAVEFRLLTSLIEADGRVLSREQLIDAVYGTDAAEVVDRTVDVHVGRLRDKLGDRADAPRFIATVRGVGYRAVVERGATEQAGAVLARGLG
jgi:DNA-binding response OmpR family regulator